MNWQFVTPETLIPFICMMINIFIWVTLLRWLIAGLLYFYLKYTDKP